MGENKLISEGNIKGRAQVASGQVFLFFLGHSSESADRSSERCLLPKIGERRVSRAVSKKKYKVPRPLTPGGESFVSFCSFFLFFFFF